MYERRSKATIFRPLSLSRRADDILPRRCNLLSIPHLCLSRAQVFAIDTFRVRAIRRSNLRLVRRSGRTRQKYHVPPMAQENWVNYYTHIGRAEAPTCAAMKRLRFSRYRASRTQLRQGGLTQSDQESRIVARPLLLTSYWPLPAPTCSPGRSSSPLLPGSF